MLVSILKQVLNGPDSFTGGPDEKDLKKREEEIREKKTTTLHLTTKEAKRPEPRLWCKFVKCPSCRKTICFLHADPDLHESKY